MTITACYLSLKHHYCAAPFFFLLPYLLSISFYLLKPDYLGHNAGVKKQFLAELQRFVFTLGNAILQ